MVAKNAIHKKIVRKFNQTFGDQFEITKFTTDYSFFVNDRLMMRYDRFDDKFLIGDVFREMTVENKEHLSELVSPKILPRPEPVTYTLIEREKRNSRFWLFTFNVGIALIILIVILITLTL